MTHFAAIEQTGNGTMEAIFEICYRLYSNFYLCYVLYQFSTEIVSTSTRTMLTAAAMALAFACQTLAEHAPRLKNHFEPKKFVFRIFILV